MVSFEDWSLPAINQGLFSKNLPHKDSACNFKGPEPHLGLLRHRSLTKYS